MLAWPWGAPWDLDAVLARLDRDPAIGWAYGVHLETSAGVLNDLPGLVARLRPRGVAVCVDVVSSLGAVELDLSGVRFAAGASGKSLGAYAGLAPIFAAPGACDRIRAGRVPASLDLAGALRAVGPGTTVGSPVVRALDRALDAFDPPARAGRLAATAALGARLRRGLRGLGLPPVAPEAHAAPVVTSFALPPGRDRRDFAAACRALGFEVATASPYLEARGWVQVATMGAVAPADVDRFLLGLARWLDAEPARPGTAAALGRQDRPDHQPAAPADCRSAATAK